MKTRYIFIMIVAAFVMCAVSYVAPVSAADAASGASLTGVVKFQGSALKPARIDMSSDPNCAKAHLTPATTEDLVVGANDALANVIVYVSDGLGDRTFDPPQQAVESSRTAASTSPTSWRCKLTRNLM